MSRVQRVSVLLESVLDGAPTPERLLDRLIVNAIDQGFDWHEIVCVVDEAERRTGLRLHPMHSHTDRP